MTMFPAHQQNLSKQNRYGGYGGVCGRRGDGGGGGAYLEGGYDCCISEAFLGSDLMAEDESRTENVNNEAGSSSKDFQQDEDKDDQGWLQLSIGGHHDKKPHQTAERGGRLIELDLLPGGSGGGTSQEVMRPLNVTHPPSLNFQVADFRATNFTNSTVPFFLQPRGSSSTNSTTFGHHQETNYLAFRPIARNIIAAPPLSSSSSFSPSLEPQQQAGSYFSRPFHVHGGLDVAGPSLDFRVVDPPRRPHSGVWFILQASQNQAKEPFLPQIPKSYLRIKDGRMTVRLLIKYLVNKLRLESESEIEITCKGQQLLPFLTLQHVRDNLWNSRRDDVGLTLVPHSTTTADHLMVLHYGRIA